jgi:flagellin-specific chaperone FliS
MKNKLNRAIKALKNLLNSERKQSIQEYLSKLSAALLNQLLSMESHQETETIISTMSAYQQTGQELHQK